MNKSTALTHLDLVIPGLFNKLSVWIRDYGGDVHAPALEQLLNNANTTVYSRPSHESLVLSLIFKDASKQVPLAVIRGGKTTQSLCADPVHFSASMNNVAVQRVTLAEQGMQDFEALINQHVAQDGLQFSLLNNEQGLLSGSGLGNVTTSSLHSVAGRSVQDKLPAGDDAAKLQTLATEIQMLLFDSPITAQCELDGQLPVNGLWFWGEGDLDGSVSSEYETLFGDALIESVAKYSQLNFKPVPESFTAVVKDVIMGRTFIQLSGLLEAEEHDDFYSWQQCLNEYEQHWFQPLLTWLKDNPKSVVRLIDDSGHCFLLNDKPWYKRLAGKQALADRSSA